MAANKLKDLGLSLALLSDGLIIIFSGFSSNDGFVFLSLCVNVVVVLVRNTIFYVDQNGNDNVFRVSKLPFRPAS